MDVNVITIRLYAPWVHSLKEKRSVAKGLMNRLRNTFNVSVIESDAQDIHQTIAISIAFLAENNALSDSIIQRISNFVEANTDAEVMDFLVERR